MVRYFDYRDIFPGNMFPKKTIDISLNFDLTRSVLVSLESHFNVLISGMLKIAEMLVLRQLLPQMLRDRLSKLKIIGKLSAYRKIIGGFQNIDNRYR